MNQELLGRPSQELLRLLLRRQRARPADGGLIPRRSRCVGGGARRRRRLFRGGLLFAEAEQLAGS